MADLGGAWRAPERGDRVGRYTVLELLGEGAMGCVYAAHDPELDRRIALKLVRAERVSDARTRARVSREARAMAKVSHPNVVAVFDAGEDDAGVFIAMELVTGVTLAEWLAERARPWREVLDAFLACGRGLVA